MPDFKYTDKQLKAFQVLKNKEKRIFLLDGGSRSGKTVFLAHYNCLRRIKYPGTRSVITRKSKTSCKNSVWKQTLLPILYGFYKGMFEEDKSNNIIKFHNDSEIWMGGFDNKQHEDDVLGQQWNDIWVNEGTDITYEIFGKLKSRLNVDRKYKEEFDYHSKFMIDCNPKGNGHWLNKLFNKGIDPNTGDIASDEIKNNLDRLPFHPLDNKENLDPEYIKDLEQLSGVNKKRFWEGIWADQVNNAVYRFDRSINVIEDKYRYRRDVETWCSLDFGTSDPTSIIWYQIHQVPRTEDNPKGILIYILDEYENTNKDVEHYAKIIKDKHYYNTLYCGDPTGVNRAVGLESWIGKFANHGIDIDYSTGHTPNELIDNANEWVKYVRLNERQTPRTLEMFENWELKTDRDNNPIEGKPLHDKYSHLGTSFYYFTANRFPIKGNTEIKIF